MSSRYSATRSGDHDLTSFSVNMPDSSSSVSCPFIYDSRLISPDPISSSPCKPRRSGINKLCRGVLMSVICSSITLKVSFMTGLFWCVPLVMLILRCAVEGGGPRRLLTPDGGVPGEAPYDNGAETDRSPML